MSKRSKPETYEVERGGRKVRVTVPEAIDEGDLAAALRDNLSPQAVAAIAAHLLAMVGDEYNALCDELGL